MKKYLASSLFVFVLTAYSFSDTLAELRAEIRIRIGDGKTDINNRHYSDDTLNYRINAVQTFIAKETLCLEARISTPSITGQREYTFNSDIIKPYRMAYYIANSNPPSYQRLEWYSMTALDKTPTWEDVSADLPTRFYTRGQKYGLVVAPSSVYASTYAVQIDYYKKPNALTTGTDVPFDGDVLLYAYHELIIKGVVIMCLEKEQDTTALKNEYYALLQKMKDEVKLSQDGGLWKN